MKRTAQAGLLALAASSLPFAAHADDAPPAAPTTAVAATTISYVENADNAATAWNAIHPEGIGVAVYMGTETDLTPEQLRTGLTNIANSGGIEDIEFFFEQNDVPHTGFALYYDDVFEGPLNLDEIIPSTQKAARYLQTNQELLQTASISEVSYD
ncbi:hypothetical protein [Hyphomonas atlantica]|uniref:Uncharacterized protein n=1 Tax=Hyphomonas atlantica TaxID=1280948 RepID=A0A059E0I5_9PROT|nr:hypothetical protein [Hyphomonas atlantica]KCZ61429.1 hypothetical protein HY36_16805 [Hyphomonas atlantica]